MGKIPITSTARNQSKAGEPVRLPKIPQAGSRIFIQESRPCISLRAALTPRRMVGLNRILKKRKTTVPLTRIVAGSTINRTAGNTRLPNTTAPAKAAIQKQTALNRTSFIGAYYRASIAHGIPSRYRHKPVHHGVACANITARGPTATTASCNGERSSAELAVLALRQHRQIRRRAGLCLHPRSPATTSRPRRRMVIGPGLIQRAAPVLILFRIGQHVFAKNIRPLL